MTDHWRSLGDAANSVLETAAHKRLSNPQADVEWLSIEDRAVMYGEFKHYAAAKGYKPGWAAMKYRDRFGDWPTPNVEATPPIEPCAETLRWIEATMREFWRTKRRGNGPLR